MVAVVAAVALVLLEETKQAVATIRLAVLAGLEVLLQLADRL
jgi:hypothetical protein